MAAAITAETLLPMDRLLLPTAAAITAETLLPTGQLLLPTAAVITAETLLPMDRLLLLTAAATTAVICGWCRSLFLKAQRYSGFAAAVPEAGVWP
jgi:hypothetical protein